MAIIIDIDGIAFEAASSELPAGLLVRVESEPYLNSVNEEGPRTRLVLAGESPGLTGEAVLDTQMEVFDRLQEAGETRFAYIRWATEDELAHIDDPDE